MPKSPSEWPAWRDAIVGGLLICCAAAPVHADPTGDAKLGATVFAAECAECHSVRPGKNKKGPTLFAVFGRRAGEVAEVKYSEAMRRSGWTWDADTLRRYVAQPRETLPGGSMKYDGLRDKKALDDLLAYLATAK
jgi:cytochrome c